MLRCCECCEGCDEVANGDEGGDEGGDKGGDEGGDEGGGGEGGGDNGGGEKSNLLREKQLNLFLREKTMDGCVNSSILSTRFISVS